MASSRKRLLWVGLGLAVAGAAVAAGLWLWLARPVLPRPGEPAYERYVEAFDAGTAAMDAGLNDRAIPALGDAVALVPGEAAGWANRGLTHLRARDPAKAKADLDRAARLAPGNPDVEEMLGLLAEDRGDLDAAVGHAEKAVAATPDDPRRLFRLAKLIETRNDRDGDARRAKLFDRILRARPANLKALGDRLELAVRARDRETMDAVAATMKKLSPGWAADARAALAKYEAKAKGDFDPNDLSFDARELGNLLTKEPAFSRFADELQPAGFHGQPMRTFAALAPVRATPDPADLGLTLAPGDGKLADGIASADVVVPFWADTTSAVRLIAADAKGVYGPPRLPPLAVGRPSMHGLLPVDLDNDGTTDLVAAGPDGVRVAFATKAGFVEAKLPADVAKGDYFGAWAADADMDGDLDVILARRKGGVLLLVNNADGTFAARPVFEGAAEARGFAWADFDDDGAPDAAVIDDKGAIHVFLNERSLRFARPASLGQGPFLAMTAADVTDDGRFDVVAVTKALRFVCFAYEAGKGFVEKELVKARPVSVEVAAGEARLQAIDLDANGGLDFVLRSPRGGFAFLREVGGWVPSDQDLPPGTADVFPDEGGALVVVSQAKAAPECPVVKGSKGYRHGVFRLRHEPGGKGDNRVNAFALGSELEVRSGTLVVKQLVERPAVYVGLGTRKKVVVARVVWTNGAAQFEFDQPADGVVKVVQRLKGSCPFLFAWDGTKMAFVTDFCWSTPLGLYINAVKRGGGFRQTTEWLKVRGDRLRPRGDAYDLRVNANLWETHYLDHLSLTAVDHPPGTEVYVDERFFLQETTPRLYLTTPAVPVAKATDQDGTDVSAAVRRDDGKYLATAGLGLYQGLTRDHWVSVDVGEVPGGGPLYLIARGWLQPTDSSINVALEQRNGPRPTPLALEVYDGTAWRQHGPLLGFPAGKDKTMVIRLEPGMRRVRLRTNMEVYWDSLRLARGLDENRCVVRPLEAKTAELRYRGVLAMARAGRTSPEVPDYERVQVGQPWRDLIGFHTRFGDVRELVAKADDRYVMMNAGDELAMTFAVPEGPREGWLRDFVWVSDGWTKDGDPNTRYGTTVLPLPYHGMADYDAPPGGLGDDPVYRRHREDWRKYHTRWVSPESFRRGLRR